MIGGEEKAVRGEIRSLSPLESAIWLLAPARASQRRLHGKTALVLSGGCIQGGMLGISADK